MPISTKNRGLHVAGAVSTAYEPTESSGNNRPDTVGSLTFLGEIREITPGTATPQPMTNPARRILLFSWTKLGVAELPDINRRLIGVTCLLAGLRQSMTRQLRALSIAHDHPRRPNCRRWHTRRITVSTTIAHQRCASEAEARHRSDYDDGR